MFVTRAQDLNLRLELPGELENSRFMSCLSRPFSVEKEMVNYCTEACLPKLRRSIYAVTDSCS